MCTALNSVPSLAAQDGAGHDGSGSPLGGSHAAGESEVISEPAENGAAAPAKRVTSRFMTKYERARLLGTRALQIRCEIGLATTMPRNTAWRAVGLLLRGHARRRQAGHRCSPLALLPPLTQLLLRGCSMNAPPMVEIGDETDALKIAEMELRARKLPLIIRRYLPNREFEDWKASELLLDE